MTGTVSNGGQRGAPREGRHATGGRVTASEAGEGNDGDNSGVSGRLSMWAAWERQRQMGLAGSCT